MRPDYYTKGNRLDIHPKSGIGIQDRDMAGLDERAYAYLIWENMYHSVSTLVFLLTFGEQQNWYRYDTQRWF